MPQSFSRRAQVAPALKPRSLPEHVVLRENELQFADSKESITEPPRHAGHPCDVEGNSAQVNSLEVFFSPCFDKRQIGGQIADGVRGVCKDKRPQGEAITNR